MHRILRAGCLIVASACGPGQGESSGGSSGAATSAATSAADTTGAPTTGASTTAPGTSTDPDTGATTVVTAAVTTTDPTEDPSGTTGALACDAIVGSTDCAALAAVSGDLSIEECMACQGVACGQAPECDGEYPCVDGVIVLQGCCTDAQCEGVAPFCGMFIGTNNVCVLHDDV